MSISSALNQAGTGLAAAARALQVASANIANAQTPGYAVRSLVLSAAAVDGVGAGVRVVGVTRAVDPVLNDLLRGAAGARAGAQALAEHWAKVEAAFGPSNGPGSLTQAITAFANALEAAIDRPDLEHRLAAVEAAASGLVKTFGALERAIQGERLAAEKVIAQDVATLTQGLARLHALNKEITALKAAGQSTLAQEDERDALFSNLSEIVPLKAHVRPDGRMLVFTASGLVLLDHKPAELSFEAGPSIGPGDRVENGSLARLVVNGRPVDGGENGPFAGGRLAAAFAWRDTEGPALQQALDDLAAELVLRFEAPGVDPTRPPGSASVFTDAGAPLSAAPEPGLAGRLSLNPLLSQAAGGDLTRWRDGLGAAAPGPVGEPRQLARWLGALEEPVSPSSGGAARSFASSAEALLSQVGAARHHAAERRAWSEGVEMGLSDRARENGVDLDAETRRLLAIETAYAANARVIQVADEMLRRLLEI